MSGRDLFVDAGATFSVTKAFRYVLWRVWDESLPTLVYLLLNPSIADGVILDPTLTRCMRRAQALGYGAMRILNAYALVSTDPYGMLRAADPSGPDNDRIIRETLLAMDPDDLLLLGWGAHAKHLNRDRQVLDLIRQCGRQSQAWCLGANADGSPRHPLYLPYSRQPVPYPM